MNPGTSLPPQHLSVEQHMARLYTRSVEALHHIVDSYDRMSFTEKALEIAFGSGERWNEVKAAEALLYRSGARERTLQQVQLAMGIARVTPGSHPPQNPDLSLLAVPARNESFTK